MSFSRNAATVGSALGVVVAVAYALPTLTFPLCRDQALFFYVGREWLHGAVPYLASYDLKPPGIYALHAVAITLFGEVQWGSRVLEIAGVVLMGVVITRLVRAKRSRGTASLGAVTLLASGWYYTTFCYWDVGQTELWEGLAIAIGCAIAKSDPRIGRGALLAGAAVGVGVLFKFPAIVMAPAVVGVSACRAWRQALPGESRARSAFAATLLHVAGVALVVALTAIYFAVNGAWPAMLDVLFGHLWDYHVNFRIDVRTVHSLGDFVSKHRLWIAMLGSLWVFGVVSAARRQAWQSVRGALWAMLLLVLSYASVVIQRRYIPYYWAVVTPFVVLCAAHGVAEIVRAWRTLVLAPAALAVAVGCLWAPPSWPDRRDNYRGVAADAIAYASGTLDRWTYLGHFTGPSGYDYRVDERLALGIRARARMSDTLQVRGHEAAFYVVSGLRSPSRFAVEVPWLFPELTYKKAEWRAEYEHDCLTASPRFAVTFASTAWQIDALRARGYRELSRDGRLVVFERGELSADGSGIVNSTRSSGQ